MVGIEVRAQHHIAQVDGIGQNRFFVQFFQR